MWVSGSKFRNKSWVYKKMELKYAKFRGLNVKFAGSKKLKSAACVQDTHI